MRHLLLLKVVATAPAEPLRCPPARMTAKERAVREEMSDVEPRHPKTEPWDAPPTLQLARCEGRGRVIVRHEVERMNAQVVFLSSFLCSFSSP